MNTNREQAVPARIYQQEYAALKSCKHGTFLYNTNDTFIGKSLDLYGEWCEAELDLLKQILQPGQVVLDIGANIGTHTVFFARQVAPEGVVFAFEPQRLVFQNLCANLALNALTNVIARQAGVGDEARKVLIPVYDPRQQMNFGALGIEGKGQGEPVEVVRIDDLELPRCDVVKIDVEGMEAKVVRGARNTLARFQPILFVENDTVEGSREVIEVVQALDYISYWQVAGYFNPGNHFANPDNVFARYQPQSNIFCFPRARSVSISGFEPVLGPEDNWIKAVERMNQRRQRS